MNIRKATIAILLAMVLCLGAAPEALAAAGDADTAADTQQTVEQKDNDSTNDNTASAAESSAQEASEWTFLWKAGLSRCLLYRKNPGSRTASISLRYQTVVCRYLVKLFLNVIS